MMMAQIAKQMVFGGSKKRKMIQTKLHWGNRKGGVREGDERGKETDQWRDKKRKRGGVEVEDVEESLGRLQKNDAVRERRLMASCCCRVGR